ncbi:hypothetical protein MRX96_022563 [Rhipicephalus microplus]
MHGSTRRLSSAKANAFVSPLRLSNEKSLEAPRDVSAAVSVVSERVWKEEQKSEVRRQRKREASKRERVVAKRVRRPETTAGSAVWFGEAGIIKGETSSRHRCGQACAVSSGLRLGRRGDSSTPRKRGGVSPVCAYCRLDRCRDREKVRRRPYRNRTQRHFVFTPRPCIPEGDAHHLVQVLAENAAKVSADAIRSWKRCTLVAGRRGNMCSSYFDFRAPIVAFCACATFLAPSVDRTIDHQKQQERGIAFPMLQH